MVSSEKKRKRSLRAILFEGNDSEPLGETHVLVQKRVRLEEFLMLFLAGNRELARDKELTGTVLRVFLYSVGHIDYENLISISQTDIAKELGMKQQDVSKAFRILATKGIFLEGDKQGVYRDYYLNEEYGWRGRGKTRQKRIQEGLPEKKDRTTQQGGKAAYRAKSRGNNPNEVA
jgi:hypothetical protein